MFEDPINDAETVNDMRAELLRQAYHDQLVRSVFMMADKSGISGEDRYVTLAYNLLKENRRLRGVVLDHFNTSPAPIIVTKT